MHSTSPDTTERFEPTAARARRGGSVWSGDATLSAMLVAQALILCVALPLNAAHSAGRLLLDAGHLAFAALRAIAYGVLEAHSPGAVTTAPGGAMAATPGGRIAALSYFSLATITTTGYGGLVPVHPFARSVANVEAAFGQLFPARFVARLVALHLVHESRREEP